MKVPSLLITFLFLKEVCFTYGCGQYNIWLDPNHVTRAEGQALCVEQGGNIAVINTDWKKDEALRAMERGVQAKEAWIGLKNMANDVMRWESGEVFSLAGITLLKHSAETCAVLKYEGTIETASCTKRRATLCMTYEHLTVNHMTLYKRHVTSAVAPREETRTISLVQCVASCQRSCTGCMFLRYTRGKCHLYDDNVTRRDFNVASQGSSVFWSSSAEAVLQNDQLV